MRTALLSLLPLAFVTIVPLAACAGGDDDGARADEAAFTEQARVDMVDAVRLPVTEISGLGHRPHAGKEQYLAIGDASSTLLTFDVASNGAVSNVQGHDLSNLFGTRESQWESVAGDGAGRVFFLEESKDTIHVVDANLRNIIHKFKLVVPADHPLAADWAADPNSRGEGMILLSNGHILVAKEKKPAALVEFAPPGEDPAGYNADLALGTKTFKVPQSATSELVATKHWLLKTADMAVMADISDLSLDDENRLLLLSDQGATIARIERTLDVTEAKIDIKAMFELPNEVKKPEGLAFAGGRPFVATDGKHIEDNHLFQVDRLP